MKIPVQVSVHLFRLRKEGITTLLLKRVEKGGGFWQGVTGAIKEGETIVQAAERELFEETGAHPVRLIDTGYSFQYPINPKWRHKYAPTDTFITEYVLVAVMPEDGEPIRMSDEHEESAWVGLEMARSRLTAFDTQLPSFERCVQVMMSTENRAR